MPTAGFVRTEHQHSHVYKVQMKSVVTSNIKSTLKLPFKHCILQLFQLESSTFSMSVNFIKMNIPIFFLKGKWGMRHLLGHPLVCLSPSFFLLVWALMIPSWFKLQEKKSWPFRCKCTTTCNNRTDILAPKTTKTQVGHFFYRNYTDERP